MKQQIVISGLGGQGVLFVSKILGEAALARGLSVLMSETHGMAQRGGNVISHVKVMDRQGEKDQGDVAMDPAWQVSPLIRPGHAHVLLALHEEGVRAHGHFLSPDGALVCNRISPTGPGDVDATGIARKLGNLLAANLVLLGFAAASGVLFCSMDDLRQVLMRLGGPRRDANLAALEAGSAAAIGDA
ncbi:indolepyruvate ferredoxin oxidoreductase beta subunit [Desulfacinum hydrothermale DSM 13146]|uniref:Indolepyruvate ferredoxin oxidoreductase beta subunit n=1 Tax=Desulfacinum hydrothermale DSM 13146 TaxID=1121390 RepID=A0A1W1X1B7_9BACT|nr:2-oxoacid:acceptor oxidoreductase family protein [Desulfacinum hydrothermale]SMC17697.1 indolepyruvate ferredoxin oxidoreductase beta subunit [Desulfacinum hydrothermale DSM 13146]